MYAIKSKLELFSQHDDLKSLQLESMVIQMDLITPNIQIHEYQVRENLVYHEQPQFCISLIAGKQLYGQHINIWIDFDLFQVSTAKTEWRKKKFERPEQQKLII